MPLASYYSLHWYGEAVGAMVTQGVSTESLDLKANGRMSDVVNGVGSIPFAKATRLVNSPLVTTGSGAVVNALPKARARVATTIKVNSLSQDDVSGALLTSTVEGSVTLRDALRLLLSVAVGKTTITDLGAGNATVVFRDTNDTKDRVTANMSGSVRTSVTKDAT